MRNIRLKANWLVTSFFSSIPRNVEITLLYQASVSGTGD